MSDGYHNGWTRYALDLAGKVAFKVAVRVFDFCSNTVFPGFQAGGGPSHNVNTAGRGLYERDHDENDFLGDFEQDNGTPLPASKRRRVSSNNDGAWIVVNPDPWASRDGSPERLSSRKTSGGLVSSAAAPSTPALSMTSLGRPVAPITRRPSSQVRHVASPQTYRTMFSPRRSSHAPVLSPTHSRQSSTVSNGLGPRSPTRLKAETHGHARVQSKKERITNKSMSKMSRQLQDLIRQGQEALGTRFSVDEEEEHAYVHAAITTRDVWVDEVYDNDG